MVGRLSKYALGEGLGDGAGVPPAASADLGEHHHRGWWQVRTLWVAVVWWVVMVAVAWTGGREIERTFERSAHGVQHVEAVAELRAMARTVVQQTLGTRAEATGPFRAPWAGALEQLRTGGVATIAEVEELGRLFTSLHLAVQASPDGDGRGVGSRPVTGAADLALAQQLDGLSSRGTQIAQATQRHGRTLVWSLLAALGVVSFAGLAGLCGVASGALRRQWQASRLRQHAAAQAVQKLAAAVPTPEDQAAAGPAVSRIGTAVATVAATTQDMVRCSHAVVDHSRAAAEVCRKGRAALGHSEKGIGSGSEAMERVVEHLQMLSERTDQIHRVLVVIDELASQTNLLSINATIEAAGSGGAGRRFAVVAEEIRLLAERAAESTAQVRALVDDINDAVKATREAVARGADAVAQGLIDSTAFGDQFEQLIGRIADTVEATEQMAQIARAQGQAVTQVDSATAAFHQLAGDWERQLVGTVEAADRVVRLTADAPRTRLGRP